ncbi:MAG: hypothetical protein FWD28_04055 [Treponema sp.]|nr:hypothetical protein [Treponema sp.]
MYDKDGVYHTSNEDLEIANKRIDQDKAIWDSTTDTKVFFKLLTKLPSILATVIVYIIVFLGSLGKVGRAIISAFFGLFAVSLVGYAIIFSIPIFKEILSPELYKSLSKGSLGYSIAGVVAIWCYIWHYNTIMCMFVNLKSILTYAFSLMLYSALFFVLVVILTPLKNSNMQNFFVEGLPMLVGSIYYLIKSIPYAKTAAYIRKNKLPLPLMFQHEKIKGKKKKELNKDGLPSMAIIPLFFHGKIDKHIDEHGRVYEGDWAIGQMHGVGKLNFGSNRFFYEGKYINCVYEGEFKNHSMCGQGKMTYPDGTVREGVWKKDKLVSEGKRR